MARRPLEREQLSLDGGRRTTQLMRDSLGSRALQMRRFLSLLLCVVPAACRVQPHIRALACPSGAWRSVTTPDSAATFCLAPDYAPVAGSLGAGMRWARGSLGDSSYAFLTVDVLDSSAAALEWGSPPRPKPFRAQRDSTVLHAIAAESVVVHRDHVDRWDVDVETGLISGGEVGFHRQPALRAVWPVASGRWVLVQGFASTPGELEVHRAMLRTLHVIGGGSQ